MKLQKIYQGYLLYSLQLYAGELQNRTDQVYALRAQLHIVESEEANQRSAVKATQEQLSAISEQHSHALLQQNDVQVKLIACF